MKIITKNNQKGMSAILFAMVFTIILSLLAVGFATLVRNDQRQTLDQTLGYQAQYAAETAINQVFEKLNSSATPPPDQDSCTSFDIGGIDGVKVTCVTWTSAGESIIYNNVDTNPKASKINTGINSYNKLRITWTLNDTSKQDEYSSSAFPNNVDADKYPILRVVFRSDNGSINKHLYFIPFNGGAPPIQMDTVASGSPWGVDCSNGQCVAEIVMNAALASMPNGYMSISTLGNVADSVTIQALQGGNTVPLLEAQYTIDATAVAQDITKRVQARVPYGVQTWRPGFAVAAERMCKDIKIDGINNDNISGGDEVCPGGAVVNNTPNNTNNPNSLLRVGINSNGGGWVAPRGYAKLTAEITEILNINNATECTWYLLYDATSSNVDDMQQEASFNKKGNANCQEGSSHTFSNLTKPGYYNIEICVYGSNISPDPCATRGGDYYRPAP